MVGLLIGSILPCRPTPRRGSAPAELRARRSGRRCRGRGRCSRRRAGWGPSAAACRRRRSPRPRRAPRPAGRARRRRSCRTGRCRRRCGRPGPCCRSRRRSSARSRSLTIGKMLRLTETRGSRAWPAAVQASRNRWICSACSWWNGTPVSSVSSVELIRFMPCSAVHSAVARVPAPHQIRSRRPGRVRLDAQQARAGWGTSAAGWARRNPRPSSTSRKTSACSRAMSAWSLPSAGTWPK